MFDAPPLLHKATPVPSQKIWVPISCRNEKAVKKDSQSQVHQRMQARGECMKGDPKGKAGEVFSNRAGGAMKHRIYKK